MELRSLLQGRDICQLANQFDCWNIYLRKKKFYGQQYKFKKMSNGTEFKDCLK